MEPTTVESLFPSVAVYCNPLILTEYHRFCSRKGEDSKTFVDRRLKSDPSDVLDAFDILRRSPVDDSRRARSQAFFDTYFDAEPDASAKAHVPEDYTALPPKFATRLSRYPRLATFAHALKKIWPDLCRVNAPEDDEVDPRLRSSLIHLPHPFFVAGGRFRECYYWDSYWIVKGLLACDMPQSAQHVADNLLYLVNAIGFVPNGNRVYYLNRSQPPFLTLTVAAVFDACTHKDSGPSKSTIDWLRHALPVLDLEYSNFVAAHVPAWEMQKNQRLLAVYRVKTSSPRPESWIEDIETARSFQKMDGSTEEEQDTADVLSSYPKSSALYSDLAAAAESGWDFSSRWFSDDDVGLASVATSAIVPVCLNSVLHATERTLSRLHDVLGNAEEAERYETIANERAQAIQELLWNEDEGIWCDYNIKERKSTGRIAASGLMPLWARCWPPEWDSFMATGFMHRLESRKLFQVGGLATTETVSGEQWDFPNMWPPLVEMAVTGLENFALAFPDSGAQSAARALAETTLSGMCCAFEEDSVMHEKYDATSSRGGRGEGGEYDPQVGFGWTNGVALELMRKGYAFEP